MNILLVNKFHWMRGGSEAAYLGLYDLLKLNNHSVACFSMKHQRNIANEYENYFVNNVDYQNKNLLMRLSALAKIIYSFEAKQKMEALLSNFKPQLAHFHNFQHQISPSVFAPLKRRNIPIILTLHDLKPLCANYKMLTHDGVCERCKGGKFINCAMHRCTKGSLLGSLINTIEMYLHYMFGYYKNVDIYIAVSKFYREKMIDYGFLPQQVHHIPNYIDTRLYTSTQSDLGYGLYFGRLSEEKGVSTLLESLGLIPSIPFVFVGAGPLEKRLQYRASELGLKNVRFAGFQAGENLRKILSESSFTVLPSEWYENCPMSVLESFAACKPVIGSCIGGIPELIDDGVDGLTFTPGNIIDLAERIKKLWTESRLRRKMGIAGREKVTRYYNPKLHYDRTIEVYNSLIRNRRS